VPIVVQNIGQICSSNGELKPKTLSSLLRLEKDIFI